MYSYVKKGLGQLRFRIADSSLLLLKLRTSATSSVLPNCSDSHREEPFPSHVLIQFKRRLCVCDLMI